MEELCAKYEKENDDYAIIMIKSLADRLAEAFAEYAHERVRKELWGYAPTERLENEDLIREKYQGIRPAPGYAACPDHTEKRKLFKLLNGEEIGVQLTESCAMSPAASVSGWYFAHPESRYFNVGAIGEDQLHSYAERKDMDARRGPQMAGPIIRLLIESEQEALMTKVVDHLNSAKETMFSFEILPPT